MKASQLREFDFGVLAAAMVDRGMDFLDVDERGYLALPPGLPSGFNLVVAVEEGGRMFVAQKDVGRTGGSYNSQALSKLPDFPEGFRATVMRDQISVKFAGQNIWTDWHVDAPNRVDIFHVGKDGEFGLYQVGIFTHDDGKSFRLHGEPRWLGKLHKTKDGFVAIPEHGRWGSFEGGTSRRTQIFQHPEFKTLVKSAKLTSWSGSLCEIEPPMSETPVAGQARVLWFITFASQKGSGIAEFPDKTTAWVQASDIVGLEPEEDGEIRLWRGDIISYESAIEGWGSKGKKGPPKLASVRLVKRPW